MHAPRASFFATHRRTILALLFGLAFSATLAYAVPPPSGGYIPGDTLDPDCAPGDVNCSVNIAGQWDVVTGGINYAGGRVGIGTTTPDTVLDIVATAGTTPFQITDGTNTFFVVQAVADTTTAIGFEAGDGSTSTYSNILGYQAGVDTAAEGANFLGYQAGYQATSANASNFFGFYAGSGAVNASNANFFGINAGLGATDASDAIFIGQSAGSSAENAANSIFIGANAGANDTVDNVANLGSDWSILIGNNTSTGGNENSIALGAGASNTASNQFALADTITDVRWGGINYTLPTSQAGGTGYVLSNDGSGVLGWQAGGISPITIANTNSLVASGLDAGTNSLAGHSIFLGNDAGDNATGNNFSNFQGRFAGGDSIAASNSNFFGFNAGVESNSAQYSNFMGTSAGYQSTSGFSNFFGLSAGQNATGSNSNFFGRQSGVSSSASNANFFGRDAGNSATNASDSFFAGYQAGASATNAANSIFIGANAGAFDTVNNTTANVADCSSGTCYSILLGPANSTGGFENSIAIGSSAVNTASNEFMIGSSTRPIDSTVFIGTAGTSCTITTGTSMSCSSDERLKTNIEDLETNTLDKLVSVRTVSYNWTSRPDADPMVGFLAQDLQNYFPQLITTGPQDYLQVNYAGMTPILVEAIREINQKIVGIGDLEQSNLWRDALTSWFASATNGIGSLFSKKIHTETLCVKKSDGTEICLDGDQLEALAEDSDVIIINNPAPTDVPAETDSSDPEEDEPEVTPEEPQTVVVEEGVVGPAPEPEPAPETPTEPAPTE